MAISSEALMAIAARMRGNCQNSVASTTRENSAALETFKDDLKTVENSQPPFSPKFFA